MQRHVKDSNHLKSHLEIHQSKMSARHLIAYFSEELTCWTSFDLVLISNKNTYEQHSNVPALLVDSYFF